MHVSPAGGMRAPAMYLELLAPAWAHALQSRLAMLHHSHELPTLTTTELAQTTGGLDAGALGGQIGGLVDQFTGGNGKGAQMGSQIGGFVQNLIGQFGGGGGGAAG